jgi:hypothetical protein
MKIEWVIVLRNVIYGHNRRLCGFSIFMEPGIVDCRGGRAPG